MGDLRLSGSRSTCLVLLALIAREVFAIGLGKCPVYPQVYNYDVKKMTGTWYEVERSFYLTELPTSCTRIDVGLSHKGHLHITVNTKNRWTCAHTTTYGVGIMNPAGSSSFRYRLNNRLPSLIGRFLTGAGQYHILATDYDQYAIVYTCQCVGIAHSDRIWVLGRTRDMPAEVRANVYSVLQNLKLDHDRLILSKNTDCPHYKYNYYYSYRDHYNDYDV